MSTSAPFIISRTFTAPRELVWQAWTDAAHLQAWSGPGTSLSIPTLDFQPGGLQHYCMRSAEGHEMWGKLVYRQIVTPELLVYVQSFSDAEGHITRHPASATWPLEMLTTLTFTEKDGGTELTIRWDPLNADETERQTFDQAHGPMTQGWNGLLDGLEAYLAKVQAGTLS